MNSMLTQEEVKTYLEINQQELEKYLEEGKLKAYRIGGTYLRFRKEEILGFRSESLSKKKEARKAPESFIGKVGQFWRFNNFYIVSICIVGVLIYYFARN